MIRHEKISDLSERKLVESLRTYGLRVRQSTALDHQKVDILVETSETRAEIQVTLNLDNRGKIQAYMATESAHADGARRIYVELLSEQQAETAARLIDRILLDTSHAWKRPIFVRVGSTGTIACHLEERLARLHAWYDLDHPARQTGRILDLSRETVTVEDIFADRIEIPFRFVDPDVRHHLRSIGRGKGAQKDVDRYLSFLPGTRDASGIPIFLAVACQRRQIGNEIADAHARLQDVLARYHACDDRDAEALKREVDLRRQDLLQLKPVFSP